MSQPGFVQHFVCTSSEALQIIARHGRYWVSDCYCRAHGPGCRRSRMDVCLQFKPATAASAAGRHEISSREVQSILDEARTKGLVARPFRDPLVADGIEGICFCCDDCCSYFRRPGEVCDRGASIESTDFEACTVCGACVPACYFGARAIAGDRLVIDAGRCYGCGLCVASCPEGAIAMTPRAGV